jgi:hypothetical protein
MNEAKQMHDELLNARLSIIPRTAYQDIRRLSPVLLGSHRPLPDPYSATGRVGTSALEPRPVRGPP